MAKRATTYTKSDRKIKLLEAVFSKNLNKLNSLLKDPEFEKLAAEDMWHKQSFRRKGKNCLLHVAVFCFDGDISIINHLLSIPEVVENITANDNYALNLAASRGYVDVVARLLQIPKVCEQIQAADNEVLSSTSNAYKVGVSDDCPHFAKVFRAQIQEGDTRSLSSIHRSAILDIASMLIEKGADINVFAERVDFRYYLTEASLENTNPPFKQKILEWIENSKFQLVKSCVNNQVEKLQTEMDELKSAATLMTRLAQTPSGDVGFARIMGYLSNPNIETKNEPEALATAYLMHARENKKKLEAGSNKKINERKASEGDYSDMNSILRQLHEEKMFRVAQNKM